MNSGAVVLLFASTSLAIGVSLAAGVITGVVPQRRSVVEEVPQVSARQQWLIQAGLDLTPRQFYLASAGVGVIAFLVCIGITGLVSVSLVPAIIIASLPRSFYARRRARNMAAVQRAWPDGLRDLVASISSGVSLQRAVENLAISGPEPIRVAFARLPYLARTLGLVPALEVIREELADPTSDRVIEILILAHQRGGNLIPEILRDLAEATVKDVWTLEEIETQSLEQKINARAVFGLPWLVLIGITAREGDFRTFYTSTGGLIVVVIGALLSGLGMFIVSRLGREPDEPRVLGGSSRILTEVRR